MACWPEWFWAQPPSYRKAKDASKLQSSKLQSAPELAVSFAFSNFFELFEVQVQPASFFATQEGATSSALATLATL